MTVYRWERDAAYGDGEDWVFRIDDDRHQEDAWIGSVGRPAPPYEGEVAWAWFVWDIGQYGHAATLDAARRACELAVLHGEAPHGA